MIRFLCTLLIFMNISLCSTCYCGKRGMKLINYINEKRLQHGLSRIPVSETLCELSLQKVLEEKRWGRINTTLCKEHSWQECCNNIDMWCAVNKSNEIFNFGERSYEIYALVFKDEEYAVNGWMKSYGHRSAILSANSFHGFDWQSIGAAAIQKTYVAWFSLKSDPYPECEQYNKVNWRNLIHHIPEDSLERVPMMDLQRLPRENPKFFPNVQQWKRKKKNYFLYLYDMMKKNFIFFYERDKRLILVAKCLI